MSQLILTRFNRILTIKLVSNLIKMNDICANIIQERLVVRHNQEGLLPVLEVVVQPDDCIQVQMVCWFVEHEQCGFDEQGPRQRDSHSPAAGKLVCGTILHLLAEAKTGQESAGFGFGLKMEQTLFFKKLGDSPTLHPSFLSFQSY